MLREDLIDKMREELVKDPKKAVKIIEEDPKILEALLNSEKERVKYVNMSFQMEQQLRDMAEKLKTTQGALLGAGLLFLLLLLKEK